MDEVKDSEESVEEKDSEESPSEEAEPLKTKQGDESKDNPPAERPITYKPLKEYTDEKKGWQKREKELLSEIQKAKSSTSVTSKVESFAKEHGLDLNQISGLVNLIKDESQVPDELLEGIQALKKDGERRDAEKQLDSDMEGLAKELPDEDIASADKAIRKFAFTKKGAKLSVYEIYFRHVKSTLGGSKSAESGRGGAAKVNVKPSFEEVYKDGSGELLKSMDLKDYTEYSKYVEKRHKAPIRRGGSTV